MADNKLLNIIQILKDEFCPKGIILFGSRARGDHDSNCDYDLVLIDAISSLPKVERMQRASDLLYPLGVTAVNRSLALADADYIELSGRIG